MSRQTLVRRHPQVLAVLVGLIVGVLLMAWILAAMSPPSDPRSPAVSTGSSISTTTVDIGDDGAVHVVMVLHFAAPVDRLTLHVPSEAWAGGEFDPVVDGITVEIAGRRLNLDDAVAAGQRRSVPLLRNVVDVRLEYDATGTFAASTPSSAGRGLVLLTPLTVKERDTLSQVEVLDDRVLNLGCVGTGELSACATRDRNTWVATPVADAEQVIAQVDLEPR